MVRCFRIADFIRPAMQTAWGFRGLGSRCFGVLGWLAFKAIANSSHRASL